MTLVTAFVTTCTGILSFAFSNDKNAHLVSIRERAEKERASCIAQIEPLRNELILLQNAPDPMERDRKKRESAILQIEALRLGLKLHYRKLLTLHVGDPDFTERIAESGRKLIEDAPHGVVEALNTSSFTPTTITAADLKKVC